MNDWQSIIGHKISIGYLQHVLEQNIVPQCMVFAGPEHVGKRTVADIFVQQMKQAHPVSAVHHINSWEEERRVHKIISIDEIRTCISGSLYTKNTEAWHIIMIDGADHLSEGASNALLKVMEEPKARVLFILIVHRVSRLLATILSRACVVRFRQIPLKVMQEDMKKCGMNVDERIVMHSCGLPGIALRSPDEVGQFDVKQFTSPAYQQLAVSSALTEEALVDVEIALSQMAYSTREDEKKLFISYNNHYIAVHSAAQIGTFQNASEHLFF
ncbi:MAG: AAA family ATPase [bacterium]|nr:AAA family ATPase [bacterium]